MKQDKEPKSSVIGVNIPLSTASASLHIDISKSRKQLKSEYFRNFNL